MPKFIKKKKLKTRESVSSTKNLNRKEIRKQKRENKKLTKHLFFSNKTNGKVAIDGNQTISNHANKNPTKKHKLKNVTTEQFSNEIPSDDNESIDSNFSDPEVDPLIPVKLQNKQTPNNQQNKKKKMKAKTSNRPLAEEIHRRDVKRQKVLTEHARKHRVRQLKLENDEEDKFIAKLEKKLKINKAKNKDRLIRKMFAADGLDFALELCFNDEEKTTNDRKAMDRASSVDNAEEEDGSQNPHESYTDDDDGDEEYDEKENQLDKEDIYGRRRDKDGNIIQTSSEGGEAYVPPHRRALNTTSNEGKQAEILERLRKQLKGLLNRLSANNLHKISSAVEELYLKNSRFNMNETLAKLLQEALIGKVASNERMVQEHMVLLSYLHAHIGSEIGANFLQMFIEQFDTLLKESHDQPNEDKRLNNVILILSYMYVFRIFEYQLLLEIVERLTNELTEKTIECLLLIFQSVGFKLRKDEPLAFKRMLMNMQSKIAAAPLDLKDNQRLKFMVDILNAIKNNNTNKVPRFDPLIHESLRKKLKSMLRNDKYVVTLNIGIEDLLRADSVGKWWIVGSAWSGTINEMSSVQKRDNTGNNEDRSSGSANFSDKLLQLAKKHKMNTEERRKIFCIIMSADDYVDAFEKILQLALKDQRSIAYVIIYCCLNEKTVNPYYSHLALKFCDHNRKYQLAFQFATWDRINDIDALNKTQLKSFALFLHYLILHGGLQLSVLKVIDFLQLDKQNYILMKETCQRLLLTKDEERLYQAFERLAKNNKLQQFKQSVRLFFQYTFLKEHESTLKLKDEQINLIKTRIQYIDKLLAYIDL